MLKRFKCRQFCPAPNNNGCIYFAWFRYCFSFFWLDENTKLWMNDENEKERLKKESSSTGLIFTWIHFRKFCRLWRNLQKLVLSKRLWKDSNRPKCTTRCFALSEKKQPTNLFSRVYIIGTTCFDKCYLFCG